MYAQVGDPTEGKYIPPWTLSNQGTRDLQWVRRKLEQGLESLAIQAIQAGCLKSKNIFDVLIDRHTVDGALFEFLQSQATITGANGDTKQLWQHALLYMKKVAGHQPINGTRIDEVLLAVLDNTENEPVVIDLSDRTGRKTVRSKCINLVLLAMIQLLFKEALSATC